MAEKKPKKIGSFRGSSLYCRIVKKRLYRRFVSVVVDVDVVVVVVVVGTGRREKKKQR